MAGTGQTCGAKTIPGRPRRSAHFPARALRVVLGSLLAFGACVAPQENGVQQAARQRETERLERVSGEQIREQRLLTLTIAEDRLALHELRDRAADAAQRRRDAKRALDAELQSLSALEGQLAAAKARALAAQQEVEALRAAEADAANRELRSRAVAEQIAQLDVQLQAAQRDLDARNAALAPQLAALQERIRSLAAIEQQLAALLSPQAPAAAPATPPADPATAPATDPKAK